jgi:hypothetical protein
LSPAAFIVNIRRKPREHAKLWGGVVSLRNEMDGKASRGSRAGRALEREITTIEREDQVSPASIGLMIAEGKNIMEGLPRTGQSSDGTAWSRYPILSAMRKSFSDKGLLPIHAAICLRKDPDARSAD